MTSSRITTPPAAHESASAHPAEPPHNRARLVDNIVYFARVLRGAGLAVGPGAVIRAVHALEIAGVRNRDDVYWTLHAVFVSRAEHRAVFAEAFRVYFRKRGLIEKLLEVMSPRAPDQAQPQAPKPGAARVSEALAAQAKDDPSFDESLIEIDARATMSARETLLTKDFALMSASELAAIKKQIAQLRLPVEKVPTRRFASHPQGQRIDLRRTLARAMRNGGDPIVLKTLRPKTLTPPLVALCDISGSMASYTRVFLHFMHALGLRHQRVHTFVFGTRLTNVTRALRQRDPDEALALCSDAVHDWSGGTRIATSMAAFNRNWSRRVLGCGAVVLLMSDGLERDSTPTLAFEMDRLHRSCRRLIWLNPLLRYEGFAARAQGIRTILAHVDEFRAVHSLESIEGLVQALSLQGHSVDPKSWLKAA